MKEILKALSNLANKPYAFLVLISITLIVYAGADTFVIYGYTLPVINKIYSLLLTVLGVILFFVGIGLAVSDKFGAAKRALDAFLAVPMASFDGDDEFKKERARALAFKSALTQELNLKTIYCALDDIDSINKFESNDFAATADFKKIDDAKLFVMVLPRKMSSSVIFEAGYAIAKNKLSVYFVRCDDDLPFMMKSLFKLSPRVRIIEYQNEELLNEKLRTNKAGLLNWIQQA